MLRIDTTSSFDRRLVAFVKSHPELKNKIFDLISRLSNNPFDQKGKTHKLSGRLSNLYSASINWNYRLVYCIDSKAITLINIGSHEEVY